MGVEKREKNSPLKSNSSSNIIFDKSFYTWDIDNEIRKNPSRVTIIAKGFPAIYIDDWVREGANIIK